MKPPRTTPLLGAGLLLLIASAGGILGQKTNTPAAGGPKPVRPANAVLRVGHSYSKCVDGFWHVVTDSYYELPGGALQKVTTTEKTSQPCKPGEIPDTKKLIDRPGPCYHEKRIGTAVVPFCKDGFWWYRYYDQYECDDHVVRILGNYFREERTTTRCDTGEQPPPPSPYPGRGLETPPPGAPTAKLPGGCVGTLLRVEVVAECDELTGYWVWAYYAWYRCGNDIQFVKLNEMAPGDRRCNEEPGKPPDYVLKRRDQLNGTTGSSTPEPARTPGPRQMKTIGLRVPTDLRGGDQVSVTVSTDPRREPESPAIRMIEFQVPLEKEAGGASSLSGVVVDLPNQPSQPADQPVSFRVDPRMPSIPVRVRREDDPGSGAPRRDIPVLPDRPSGGVPAEPDTPPVCTRGRLDVVRGDLGGDARRTRISIGGRPAAIAVETPRAVYFWVPVDAPLGENTLTIDDRGRRRSCKVWVVSLEMWAKDLNLIKGQSTEFTATVRLPGNLPDSAWSRGGRWDDLSDSTRVARLDGKFRPPAAGERGFLLLTIENRSPQTISIDKSPLVLRLEKGDFAGGVYTYRGTIRSHKSGGFNVYGEVQPFLSAQLLADEVGGGGEEKREPEKPDGEAKKPVGPTTPLGGAPPRPPVTGDIVPAETTGDGIPTPAATPATYATFVRQAIDKDNAAKKEKDPARKKKLEQEAQDAWKRADAYRDRLSPADRDSALEGLYGQEIEKMQNGETDGSALDGLGKKLGPESRKNAWKKAEANAREKAAADRADEERLRKEAKDIGSPAREAQANEAKKSAEKWEKAAEKAAAEAKKN
jgi:hypothetical protein